MLVKELMALLDRQDPEAPVVFAFNYGDHSRTMAVDDIRRVEVRDLTKTGYSPSGLCLVETGDYVPEPEAEDVVVLL